MPQSQIGKSELASGSTASLDGSGGQVEAVKGRLWKRRGHRKEVRSIAASDFHHTTRLDRSRFQTAKTRIGGQLIGMGFAIGKTWISNRIIGCRNGLAHSCSPDLHRLPGNFSTVKYHLRAI